MKIVVLIENTAPEGSCLAAEHGLSFYVEHRGRAILLDAGASGSFADNAAALGWTWDRWTRRCCPTDIMTTPAAWAAFCLQRPREGIRPSPAGGAYFSTSMGEPRFIGVSRELWEGQRDRFETPEGLFQLFDGAWLVPESVHGGPFASRETNLLRQEEAGGFVPDDFSHEHSLVLEGSQGPGAVQLLLPRGDRQYRPWGEGTAGQTGVRCVRRTASVQCQGGQRNELYPEYALSVADALVSEGGSRSTQATAPARQPLRC